MVTNAKTENGSRAAQLRLSGSPGMKAMSTPLATPTAGGRSQTHTRAPFAVDPEPPLETSEDGLRATLSLRPSLFS